MSQKGQRRRVDIPWRQFVVKADPDYEKDRRDEPEYEFSNRRVFTARNSNKRGAYGDA